MMSYVHGPNIRLSRFENKDFKCRNVTLLRTKSIFRAIEHNSSTEQCYGSTHFEDHLMHVITVHLFRFQQLELKENKA